MLFIDFQPLDDLMDKMWNTLIVKEQSTNVINLEIVNIYIIKYICIKTEH